MSSPQTFRSVNYCYETNSQLSCSKVVLDHNSNYWVATTQKTLESSLFTGRVRRTNLCTLNTIKLFVIPNVGGTVA